MSAEVFRLSTKVASMARFTRKDFLGALFQEYFREREGFIIVKSSKALDRKTSIRYFPNIEILAKEPYQNDQDVFFGLCPHEKMRAEKSHVQYLVALWAGLDLDPEGYSGRQTHFFGEAQAAKAIRSFPLPPSIIVESGRGVHLYWLLKELTPIADVEVVERLLRRINSYFRCNTELGIDSVLRLPDTINARVSGQLTSCRVKYLNTDFRYDFGDIEQLNLGVTDSSSKSTVFGRPTEATLDVLVDQAEPASDSAATSHAAGEEVRDRTRHAGFLDDDSKNMGPRTGAEKAHVVPAEKTAASSLSEPIFEREPYEQAGKRPSVLPQLQPTGIVAEEVLDRVADKLADKIADRITKKLVDEIVSKVVERLMPHH